MFRVGNKNFVISCLLAASQIFIFFVIPSTSLAAGATSSSQLTSLGFSQARIESGKSAAGLVNGLSSGTVTPVYGCYQATWLSANISPGSTSWSPGNFTLNNAGAGKVTESWNFWTHKVSGSFVDSQPSNCTYANSVSPDISASIDVYPVGSLSPATQTITATAGNSITASSALTPNASWPDTLVYSVTPSLPNGLTLNTSTGSITGTPTSAQSSTNYTITAKTTSNSVVVWDATATVSISVSSSTPPGAPTINSITSGDSQLSIDFTAGSSGSATITDYKYSTDNGSNWTSAGTTSSPITITGLTNGTTYNVKIRAVSSAGDGTASSASAGTPKGNQIVTWSPTNTSVLTTASPLTPSQVATTNGDGVIGYAVQNAGTTGCTVNASTGVLTFSTAGSCVIRATAASTTSFNSGYKDVTFTITEPTSTPSPAANSTTDETSSASPASTTLVAATTITLGASIGEPVAGSVVEVSATGMKTNSDYSLVVRSTPKTLASGKASAGSFSISALVPSGLEAGWHSLTFSSTAANGNAVVSTLYFEVSSKGTLVKSTGVKPSTSALAKTGADVTNQIGIAVLLMIAGFSMLFGARKTAFN